MRTLALAAVLALSAACSPSDETGDLGPEVSTSFAISGATVTCTSALAGPLAFDGEDAMPRLICVWQCGTWLGVPADVLSVTFRANGETWAVSQHDLTGNGCNR